jgi:hypothetical protein
MRDFYDGRIRRAGAGVARAIGRRAETGEDTSRQLPETLEPTVCWVCGAVCDEGRWQWRPVPREAHLARCAACLRTLRNDPAGAVSLGGSFVREHRDAVRDLVRQLAATEWRLHATSRIIALQDMPCSIRVTTTDIRLPRRIAEAARDRWGGEISFGYGEGRYFLHARWWRGAPPAGRIPA